MAASDVERLFKLRDDVTASSALEVRRAAAADAGRLKTVLRSYSVRVVESDEKVNANGLTKHGYAPRIIYATGPETVFVDYSRPIRNAMGTWYVSPEMSPETRKSGKPVQELPV
ncbi:MAG: hypothetical protein HY516_02620 [Candidatus Aenigmarchaeota archaeon]|nr:hypothetical protein [Candidatus Aenigmarchaeota archaeon]